MSDEMLERLQAALAEHYAVERLLGEGGMAIVYLARDIKHDRQVALKILKPELAASLGGERFLREIQITAKLSHPHILPLYDSGAADGLLYYVMPFVVGESLSDYIAREQQLSLDEAVRIAREVAEALSHAHSMGLIHRDIKPDNVLLSGGHAIVADFGISRAVSEAGGDKLTQTGMAVGTPAYMAPEQAAGDPNVDARADVYSLGCMLYEMLVGTVPFTGPTAMAIMARHTMDHVTPPSIMRQSIPPELEDVVLRALEKVPADRYRTAHEMAQALIAVERGDASGARISTRLRASQAAGRISRVSQPVAVAVPDRRRYFVWAGAGVGALALALVAWQVLGNRGGAARTTPAELGLRNVAVLYFDDLSPDSSLGYLADGLTEGLISQLSQVRGLDVISRNGVAPYRGTTVPRDSIARVLGVGTVMAGSVEPAGNRVRVTTRLVDASGADFKRATFELPGTELLAARESLAVEVARALREWLGEEVRLRDRRAQSTDVTAWTLLQRAEKLRKDAAAAVERGDRGVVLTRYQMADSLLTAAAAADPKWAEPLVLRGQIAYQQSRLQRGRDALPGIERAVADAGRALAIDPNHPEALELRGTAGYWRWLLGLDDPPASDSLLARARADLDSAVSRDPTLASAHNTLSHLQMRTGDKTGGVLSAQRAYEEDAYLGFADAVLHRLYQGYYDLRDLRAARRWCQEGRRRFPRDARFAQCELMLLASQDDREPDVARAWTLAGQIAELAPPAVQAYRRHQAEMLVGGVLARAGLVDSARQVLARARADRSIDPHFELAFFEAYIRTLTNEPDSAIALLKRYLTANPEQDHGITAGELYWWWVPLRGHPRFGELTVGRR